jgi:hypothetical protein
MLKLRVRTKECCFNLTVVSSFPGILYFPTKAFKVVFRATIIVRAGEVRSGEDKRKALSLTLILSPEIYVDYLN